MKTRKTNIKILLWLALLLPMLLALKPETAQATHFRYGHLTWQPLTGNSVRFTLTDAFRRTGYAGTHPDGSVAVGDIFQEDIGATGLNFGDGGFTGVLDFKVISIDPANNWCLALALEPGSTTKTTIDHTYASANNGGSPWVADINSCCRTLVEANNPSGNYRVLTYVETATGNRSPSSSLPAIVNMMQSASASFLVTAADPDANTVLTYRLATPSEAAGNGSFNQPTGLTINPLTGVVTWNTLANAVVGSLYSCQVIIEDRSGSSTAPIKTQVAVDFLIYITPLTTPCDVNLAPTFTQASPVCGSSLSVNEGQAISFTMVASDPDAGNVVSLNSGGGPSGSTFTPNLPNTGNPVSTTFNWTPGAGTSGAYVVTFTATDSCGAQTLCSVTIQVLASACNLNIACRSIQPTCFGSTDGSATVTVTGGSGNYGYLWSNGATTRTIGPVGAGTYTVTVTDLVTQCTKTKVIILKKAKVTVKTTLYKSCGGLCNGSITALGGGGNGGPFTYLWSNGETTATLHNVCPNVYYTITVTDRLGCTVSCARKVGNITTCPVRLSENADSKLVTVGPNPFSNNLTVNVTTDEDLTVTVTDITGRVYSRMENVNSTFELQNNWNGGMYFITVENADASYRETIKIIRAD